MSTRIIAVFFAIALLAFVLLACDENHAGMTPEEACRVSQDCGRHP